MRILALDTALGACSVAIVDGNEVLGQCFEGRTRGHAERLMDMLSEVEAEAGLTVKDMDRLAVTIGPGTFTGLRVGLSAAKGLALATGRPLVGLTTLQAVAANVSTAAVNPDAAIAAVFDCRRGEVYFQVFDAALSPLTKPSIDSVDGAVAELNRIQMNTSGPVRLVGSGAGLVQEQVPGAVADDSVESQPVAARIARLAAAIEDPASAPADPLYLRKPDAKLPRKNPLKLK